MYHHATHNSPDLLAEWRWLLGGLPRLCGWSTAGDLFYADDQGAIWRLDTGAGTPEVVAPSEAAFERVLAGPTGAADLLLLPIVRAFEASHGPLGPEQCLGFTTLPVFGGSYAPDNRYSIRVTEHAAFTGGVHQQIRDLPDGAALRIEVIP